MRGTNGASEMAKSDESIQHIGTKRWITRWCRRLKPEHVDWINASDPTRRYNCMGFACGPVDGKLRWWQAPIRDGETVLNPTDYWPDVLEGDDLDSFIKAAESVGYTLCGDGDEGWREGFDTMVIYYQDNERKPFVHAALYQPNGRMLSKMAEHSDFEHEPDAFDDVINWIPVRRKTMRRPPALAVPISMGTGNATHFPFNESTSARFPSSLADWLFVKQPLALDLAYGPIAPL